MRRTLRLSSLVSNALDAAEWARVEFGRRPVLVGSSQGGVLAVLAAADDPELAGVVAHNVLDPQLRESLQVSRLPRCLTPVHGPLLLAMRILARIAPRLPIPFGAYLDIDRVCREDWTAEQFLRDPLGLRAYPLRFLADLFTADLSAVRAGAISCPVVVVAGRRDPLFGLDYTRRVFDRIGSSNKQLVVFDTDRHLLFNETLPLVLGPVADMIAGLDARG